MGWVIKGDADKEIIEEIQRESDRGAIIVGVSLLEVRLEELLRTRMSAAALEVVGKNVFSGSGPLSSFSAKIDLGFLLQLYPYETYRLLDKVRRIRNTAAHKWGVVNFLDPQIRDQCESLRDKLESNGTAWFWFFHQLAEATKKSRGVSLQEMEPLRVLNDDGTEITYLGYGYGDAKSCFLAAIKQTLLQFHIVHEIYKRIPIVISESPISPPV